MVSVDYLYVISNRKVNQVSLAYKRPLFYQINWDNHLDEIHKYNYPDLNIVYTGSSIFKRKSFDQIKDEKDSFLAIDSIEIGNGNRIPLWLFGFID